MTKKGLDRMESQTLCTARRRNGEKCLNYAVKGATVCRMHGGSAPQVRAAAQTRILMASDLAAKKLVELMSSAKVDDRVKLAAAKDLLDRANLAGTQNIEVGVTKRSFEDHASEIVFDAIADDDQPALPAPSDIVDADVIEDDYEYDDDVQNRFDRRTFTARETADRAREIRGMSVAGNGDQRSSKDIESRRAQREQPSYTSPEEVHSQRIVRGSMSVPGQSTGRTISPKRYAKRQKGDD